MIDMKKNEFPLPSKILLLGYGAIGKCFADILLKTYPESKLYICDFVFPEDFSRIFSSNPKVEKIDRKITKENLEETFNFLSAGDFIVDLSTNICYLNTWGFCQKKQILYMNTALEEWEDDEDAISFPNSLNELYNTSLLARKEKLMQNPLWNKEGKGATSVFEHGMNPGLISHFVKKGLLDAAKFFIENKTNENFSKKNFDFEKIQKFKEEKNYPKLAQALKLFSVHCAETDNQTIIGRTMDDVLEKFYNTWSCRGFLTESLVPIQVSFGSHEDKEQNQRFPRVNDKMIMSWTPSRFYSGIFLYF
jgi:homospermidine synthase